MKTTRNQRGDTVRFSAGMSDGWLRSPTTTGSGGRRHHDGYLGGAGSASLAGNLIKIANEIAERGVLHLRTGLPIGCLEADSTKNQRPTAAQ